MQTCALAGLPAWIKLRCKMKILCSKLSAQQEHVSIICPHLMH